MAVNRYVRGALVRVSAAFTNLAGSAVDPSVVRVKVRAPGQTTLTQTSLLYGTDAALVKDSTGNYHADVDTTSTAGIWYYRWESTGTGQAAGEREFMVAASSLD